jgi:predicted TPR repeat methyltransferase
MDYYDPTTYGERIADVYDEMYADMPFLGDVDATVGFIRDLAGDGPVLELGIGTGRVAIPLRASGVEVHGIDASEAMVARLRAKPGGEDVPVTLCDFADFALENRFRVTYVVFNTFFALLSQGEQVSCFRAVARHLTRDGVFVMEAFVPDVARFVRGQNVSAVRADTDGVTLEVSTHRALEQRTDSQRVILREEGIRLYPVRIRYAFVSELDLMAQLAGMRLRERWADWDRTPFGEGAGKHVSVWHLEP